MTEDLYKNCRWCHWFKDGKCLHDQTFKADTEDVVLMAAEEGVISEAVKEGFSERAFDKLKVNLESSLSKKKAKEFMQAFYEELEAAKQNWTETIDEAVTAALQNEFNKNSEAVIIDPYEFYCKYFM